MDGDEFAEWEYHFSEVPFVDPFWIGAQICQVIANVMGSGKRFKVDDFLPMRRKRKQEPEEIGRNLHARLN